jgi:non-ribosomal peptide synthetase component F
VERGVGTGTRFETDALIMTAGMSHRTITERILGRADRDGPALIDAGDGTVTAWPLFAQTVRAAAAGLARRGVVDGDTVGVLADDAASYATAVHAIRAAGASAAAIRAAGTPGTPGTPGTSGPDAEIAEIAAQLNECRARMLITTAPLARVATQAADRSWVRQVISFGEAEGTTPFSALLDAVPWPVPLENDPGPAVSADGLTHRDVVVAAPPCGAGQAYTSLLDLVLLIGATVVAAPVSHIPAALRTYRGTAAIVPEGTCVPGLPPSRVMAVA